MSLNDNIYWDKKCKLFDVYYVYRVPRRKMKTKILKPINPLAIVKTL